MLERNDELLGRGARRWRASIFRHVPETGDAAPAAREGRHRHRPQPRRRSSSPRSRPTPTSRSTAAPRATIYYLGLNQKNANLAKPEVREALQVAGRLRRDRRHHRRRTYGVVHQAFLPEGLPRRDQRQALQARRRQGQGAARQGRPAGRLHGHDGRAHDRRRSPTSPRRSRRRWAQAGIKLEIIPGDGKQTLTKYRARTHDIYIGQLGPGLSGPAHQRRDLRHQPGQRRRRRSRRRWPGATPGTSRR